MYKFPSPPGAKTGLPPAHEQLKSMLNESRKTSLAHFNAKHKIASDEYAALLKEKEELKRVADNTDTEYKSLSKDKKKNKDKLKEIAGIVRDLESSFKKIDAKIAKALANVNKAWKEREKYKTEYNASLKRNTFEKSRLKTLGRGGTRRIGRRRGH